MTTHDRTPMPLARFSADHLGIELTDWQVKIAEHVMDGGQITCARRAGRATTASVIRAYHAYLTGYDHGRERHHDG